MQPATISQPARQTIPHNQMEKFNYYKSMTGGRRVNILGVYACFVLRLSVSAGNY